MASANNVFSCCDIFLRPSEHKNVFSSSGEVVLPPLKQVVADVSGKADKLPNVFLLGSKLCGPWHRRLEAIDPLNAVRFRRKSKALDSKQKHELLPLPVGSDTNTSLHRKKCLRLILALVVMHYYLVHLWPWILPSL